MPIVEPEVLMDGAHALERCAEVTVATLRSVYEQLARHRVVLEASLLKPNMVLPGRTAPTGRPRGRRDGHDRRPAPGRAGGGPGDRVPLRGPVRRGGDGEPGRAEPAGAAALGAELLFGRALQAPVLRAWAGDSGRVEAARAALLHRAALNGAARRGAYRAEMEQPVACP